MNLLVTFFNKPLLLGAFIVIPFILFLLNLILKNGFKASAKDSITTAFCIYLMYILTNNFGSLLSEFGKVIALKLELTSSYTDISQSVAMTVSQTSQSGFYILPFAILLNLILLLCGCIRTFNLDFWSIWIASFAGGMAEIITGKLSYGLIVTGAVVIVTLVISDSMYSDVEKYCNLPSITFSNNVAVSFAPIGGIISKIFSFLPKVLQKDITLGYINKKIGYWGKPTFLSTIVVFITLLICSGDFITSIQMAITMGAYIFILPRIMIFLSDSLKAFSQGLKTFSSEKFGLIGNINLALPIYCGLGNPAALVLSVICVPIVLVFVKIFNFTTYIPFENFMYLPYIMLILVLICRGGIIKTIISAIISYFTLTFVSQSMAGVVTKKLEIINPELYANKGAFTTFYGVTPFSYITNHLITFGITGLAIIIVITILLLIWNYNRLTGYVKKYIKKTNELRPSNIDKIEEEKENKKLELKRAVEEKIIEKTKKQAEKHHKNIEIALNKINSDDVTVKNLPNNKDDVQEGEEKLKEKYEEIIQEKNNEPIENNNEKAVSENKTVENKDNFSQTNTNKHGKYSGNKNKNKNRQNNK